MAYEDDDDYEQPFGSILCEVSSEDTIPSVAKSHASPSTCVSVVLPVLGPLDSPPPPSQSSPALVTLVLTVCCSLLYPAACMQFYYYLGHAPFASTSDLQALHAATVGASVQRY